MKDVSIPYRHAKNGKIEKIRWWIAIVSIPYRHAKNNKTLMEMLEMIDVFQFLIGTLKTFH